MSDDQTQGWNICKLLHHPCQQLEQQKPTVSKEDVLELIKRISKKTGHRKLMEFTTSGIIVEWLEEICLRVNNKE